MAHHTPVQADPAEIRRAQDTWDCAVCLGKWSALGVVAVLAVLGIIFIDW